MSQFACVSLTFLFSYLPPQPFISALLLHGFDVQHLYAENVVIGDIVYITGSVGIIRADRWLNISMQEIVAWGVRYSNF